MPKKKSRTPLKPLRRMVMSSALPRPAFSAGEIATRERGLGYSLNGLPLPDPDPVLKRMGRDITAYTALLSDAYVGGCAQSRKAGVLKLQWAVDRGRAASPAAELVQDVFAALNMRRIVSEILDAPLFGRSVSEVIWSLAGNLALPSDVRHKPPEWFVFGEQGVLRFKTPQNPNGEAVPPRKFLKTVNNGGWANPYGVAELSKVFWPATFKKGGLKFWAVFTEKYGMPHVVAKQPRGKNDQETAELLGVLGQMVQDAIAVIPDDSSVEIKTYTSAGSVDVYERFLNYCKSEIAVGLLGQTLTTEVGDKGSYAAAQTHMEVRADIVNSDKALVEETLTGLAGWIVELNMPGAEPPQIGLYAPEDVDLELAQRDEILTRQGLRLSKDYYQREYGLEEEDFELTAPQAQAGPLGAFAGKAAAPEEEGAPAHPAHPDEIAGAVSAEEMQREAEGLLKPVFTLVKDSASHDELLNKLAELYPAMDTAALEEKLTHVIFISDLLALAQREQAA